MNIIGRKSQNRKPKIKTSCSYIIKIVSEMKYLKIYGYVSLIYSGLLFKLSL